MKTLEDRLQKRLDVIDKEIEDGADRKRLLSLRQRVYRILRKINECGCACDTKMFDILVQATYTAESIKEFIYC